MLWWRSSLHLQKGINYQAHGGDWSFVNHSCFEQYNQVTLFNTHTRPPGNRGHQGFYGSPPVAPLCSGAPGAPGAVQIKVKSSNGMESVYPGKYHLTVTSFEVVDENGDMIMEPGEHIIVRNICVQNSGIYFGHTTYILPFP